MDIVVENRPVYLIALSEREVRNALSDPTHLQAMMRRKLIDGDAPEKPLSLPAPAKKIRAPHKVKTIAEHKCEDCGKTFKLAGWLKAHREKHHAAEANG